MTTWTFELLNDETEVNTIPPDIASAWMDLLDQIDKWSGDGARVATMLGRHANGDLSVQLGVVLLADGEPLCFWQNLANLQEPVFATAVVP